jgi:hypothetical protein
MKNIKKTVKILDKTCLYYEKYGTIETVDIKNKLYGVQVEKHPHLLWFNEKEIEILYNGNIDICRYIYLNCYRNRNRDSDWDEV